MKYKDFKKYFIETCVNYVANYFYSYEHRSHVAYRDAFIQEYLKKHRKEHVCDETVIKALRAKARSLKKTLPDELKVIIPRLLPRKINTDKTNTRGQYLLYAHFQKSPNHWIEHFPTIIAYYIILIDVMEIKHWAKQSNSMLHDNEGDVFQATSYEICRWKLRLTYLVDNIRFKYEWFAVFVAMNQILRPHRMRCFAELMNCWFPNNKHSCSLTSLDDYTFLLNHPVEEWTDIPIPSQSKATVNSIKRIKSFYSRIELFRLTFSPEHLLMNFMPEQ